MRLSFIYTFSPSGMFPSGPWLRFSLSIINIIRSCSWIAVELTSAEWVANNRPPLPAWEKWYLKNQFQTNLPLALQSNWFIPKRKRPISSVNCRLQWGTSKIRQDSRSIEFETLQNPSTKQTCQVGRRQGKLELDKFLANPVASNLFPSRWRNNGHLSRRSGPGSFIHPLIHTRPEINCVQNQPNEQDGWKKREREREKEKEKEKEKCPPARTTHPENPGTPRLFFLSFLLSYFLGSSYFFHLIFFSFSL